MSHVDAATSEPSVAAPPGNPRFPLLDSLRGLAALSIVGIHLTSYTWAFRHGWPRASLGIGGVGIATFFLMSGFLLYRPFVWARVQGRPRPSLRRYSRARVLRLVPGYWFALTILALWPGLPGHVFGRDSVIYYTFTQDYSTRTLEGGIRPAWTLGTELCFIVFLPFYAWLAARPVLNRTLRRVVVGELSILFVLACGTFVFRSRVTHVYDMRNWPGELFPGSFDWFAVGMALAVVSAVVARRGAPEGGILRLIRHRPGVCYSISFAVLFADVVWTRVNLDSQWATDAFSSAPPHLLYALAAIFASLPAIFGGEGGLSRRLLRLHPLPTIGAISYGIYLWHVPLIQRAEMFVVWHPQYDYLAWPLRVGAAFCAIGAGYLSYRFVERPLLLLKNRRVSSRAPDAAPAASGAS